MNDPADPAVLYFRRAGNAYRVKVFDSTVWIEAQPGGDNLPYERADHPAFDGQAWDFDALAKLIDTYRENVESAGQEQFFKEWDAAALDEYFERSPDD